MSEVPTDDKPELLDKAIDDLENAQEHLSHARSEETQAEREVAEALREIKDAGHHTEQVTVHVLHVIDTERASFKVPLSSTLQHVWDKAYVELETERKPNDVFQSGGKHPASLMSHLTLTLDQAKKQHVITDYHFGIVCETGGA